MTYAWPQSSGLVRLESIQGLWGSRFHCLHPHLVATGLITEHTFSVPSPKSDFAASHLYACAACKSWKAAELPVEQVWESGHFTAKMVQMVPKWPMACTPFPHHAFFTDPCFLQHMHIICMVGVGSGVSMGVKTQVGQIGHVLGVQLWGGPWGISRLRCSTYGAG